MSRWAAIVAGGSGTRFWPLSTTTKPKQLLPLAGSEPLLRQSVTRLDGLIPAERILVITGRPTLDETVQLLPEVARDNILIEPRAASTAPALTWATAVASERDEHASVLSLHADWHVGDAKAFRRTASKALEVAEKRDMLVTVGVVPTRPDTGYGYIEPGEAIEGDVRKVRRFTEKPDSETAERLIARGALWNSGLFAWTAARFFTETKAVAPEISPHLSHLERNDVTKFFASVTPIAVDFSHFERSSRVAVVPGTFPWDDVGTWTALRRVQPLNGGGNVLVGPATVRDATDCIAWAEEGSIVLDGVRGLVVVRANGVTLVTTADRAAHLKELVASLPDELRDLGAGGE